MNLIELQRSLRQLRLGGMAAVLETRLHQAQAEPMAPLDLLATLVNDELTRRSGRLLERRRSQLIERLQHSERSLVRSQRPMDDYERSLAEQAKETIAADLSWVERLLDREHHLVERLETPTSSRTRPRRAARRAHDEPPVAGTSGTDTKQGERPAR